MELCKVTRMTALSRAAPQIILTSNVNRGFPAVSNTQQLELHRVMVNASGLGLWQTVRTRLTVNLSVVAGDVISRAMA